MSSPADAATLDRIFNECFAGTDLAGADQMTDRAQRDWVRISRARLAERRASGITAPSVFREESEEEAHRRSMAALGEVVLEGMESGRYVIKDTSHTTFGGDAFASDADESRAGLEAEVASLKETVASLEGKVSALQEQSEKLFAILEARPEQ